MDKSVKDCTFKDYLMELQVSDDPAQAMLDVKTAAKNPDRYVKQHAADMVDKEREVKQSTDDKNKAARLALIQAEKQTAMKRKNLVNAEKRTEMEMGIESGRPVAGMA